MIRVLFVEDEPRGVNPYFSSLAKRGFDCTLAKNGDEAVAKLRAEKFDILSLDIMFDPGKAFTERIEPRRAGLYLLELIRQGKISNCDPNLKVIILTAVVNPQLEEIMKRLGVHAYLKKPVPFNKVIETFMSVKP
ncbi:response regulator [bacterium]|nr:response regulator [bacterium]